jgi:hypothetical protein
MFKLAIISMISMLTISFALVRDGAEHLTSPIRIAGKYTASFAPQFAADIPDTSGHSLSIAQGRGTNRNVGAGNYMDGAEMRMVQTEDLTQGNGTAAGYTMFARGADTTRQRFTGKVRTTLAPDKSLQISFAGRWTGYAGTGRYKGVTGSGTYRGHFVSPSEYVVEWEGGLSPHPAAR